MPWEEGGGCLLGAERDGEFSRLLLGSISTDCISDMCKFLLHTRHFPLERNNNLAFSGPASKVMSLWLCETFRIFQFSSTTFQNLYLYLHCNLLLFALCLYSFFL